MGLGLDRCATSVAHSCHSRCGVTGSGNVASHAFGKTALVSALWDNGVHSWLDSSTVALVFCLSLTVIVSYGRVLIQEEAALAVLPGCGREEGADRLISAVFASGTGGRPSGLTRWDLKMGWTDGCPLSCGLVIAVTPPSNPVSLNKMLFWLNKCFDFIFFFVLGNQLCGQQTFNRQ